jgi:hypothetical protein
MFEIGLHVGWSFGGNTAENRDVVFDIATDGNIAGCPFVQLEVLPHVLASSP